MRKRDFCALIGGAAAAWPIAVGAQQGERVRRIGVLMFGDENDPVRGTKGWLSTFTRRLAELGWTDGRNLRMDVRWDGDNVDRRRMYAKELADLQPDVILAGATPQTAAFQQQTRTIPDRVCARLRPDRLRLRCEPAAPRREYHRLQALRRGNGGQMAGVAHGDRARCQAGSIDVQSRHGTLC